MLELQARWRNEKTTVPTLHETNGIVYSDEEEAVADYCRKNMHPEDDDHTDSVEMTVRHLRGLHGSMAIFCPANQKEVMQII